VFCQAGKQVFLWFFAVTDRIFRFGRGKKRRFSANHLIFHGKRVILKGLKPLQPKTAEKIRKGVKNE
jgi:hypothetical protein